MPYCHVAELLDAALEEEGGTLIARKVGEAVQNTLGAVVGAIDIPLGEPLGEPTPLNRYLLVHTLVKSTAVASFVLPGLVKDAARPAYWVPDQDIHSCNECQREFSPRLSIHHCRACGQGVCGDCSQGRRAVPSRGWDHTVRVCNSCNEKAGEL